MIDVANQIYLNAQFSIALGFLVWLYLFRNESYYFVRNMFVVSMGLAALGYTIYPTAPPRMFPEYGFVDTINDFSNVNHDSGLAKIFINPYAAVPSMHCAFAMMIGGTGFMVCRNVVRQSLLGRLAVPGRLGHDRHRQPLLGGRGARLGGGADRGAGRPARWPAPGPRPGPSAPRARARPRLSRGTWP